MQERNDHKFSIVIVVHDQAMEVELNLPRFLTLQGDVDYEVIVVDDFSTDETPDVLQRLKTEYPRLYTTFLPKSVVFNPSRMQLAMTVGAKAAHHEWVVLADISRPPGSENWLSGILSEGGTGSEAVLVYTNRRGDSIRHQAWNTLEDVSPLLLKAERRSGRGHKGKWQKFRRGLYDAVAVRCERVHDAIRLFDLKIRGRRLWRLRLRVYWKNSF